MGESPPSDAMRAVYRLPTFALERVSAQTARPVGNTMQKVGSPPGTRNCTTMLEPTFLEDTTQGAILATCVQLRSRPVPELFTVGCSWVRNGTVELKQTASVPVAAAKCKVRVTWSRVAAEKPLSTRV